jgi:universal stress protein A
MITDTPTCVTSNIAEAAIFEPIVFKRILVAIDNSAPARRAAAVAISVAGLTHATIAFLNVASVSTGLAPEAAGMLGCVADDLHEAGRALLHDIALMVPPGIATESFVRNGDPTEEIVAAAREWEADLIVIGNNARTGIVHLLLGSTAESVVRRASCPVLTVNQLHLSASIAGGHVTSEKQNCHGT